MKAALVALALAVPAVAVADTASPTAVAPERKKPKKPLPPYKPGPPDRVAIAAAEDANLVPSGTRSGVIVTVALGSAFQLGSGLEASPQIQGGTGSFSGRIGHVANRDTVIYLELTFRALPYKDSSGASQVNNHVLLGMGGQLYVSPAFWVRAGLAFASFAERESLAGGGVRNRFDNGVGTSAGAGFDIARRRWFTLALEVSAFAAMHFPGFVGSGGAALSGTIDI